MIEFFTDLLNDKATFIGTILFGIPFIVTIIGIVWGLSLLRNKGK